MIKQPPINWWKLIFITIATYSFLRDFSIQVLPTYHILTTCIFLFFIFIAYVIL